mgnify:CR=1 FL=1
MGIDEPKKTLNLESNPKFRLVNAKLTIAPCVGARIETSISGMSL